MTCRNKGVGHRIAHALGIAHISICMGGIGMTKTHNIDGVTYVEVERKAEVGEKIIMIDGHDLGYELGDVFDVNETGKRKIAFFDNDGDRRTVHELDRINRYRVLVPQANTPKASPEVVNLIANLAARLTTLERKHAEEADTLHKNVLMLGEELETLKQAPAAADTSPVTLPRWLVDKLLGGYSG